MTERAKFGIMEDGTISVREAGRMGGEAVKNKYGPEFFSKIGKMGGEALAARGFEYYSRIGRQGGEAIREKYGSEHFSRIGKMRGRHPSS